MDKVYVGIDIGKNGAIVALYPNGAIAMNVMPKIGKEIDQNGVRDILNGILNECTKYGYGMIFGMEDVHSMFGTGAKSNFEFGRALGIIEAMMSVFELPFYKFSPKTWQKICFEGIPVMKKPGAPAEGRGGNDTKAMASLAAARLYPGQDFRKSNRATNDHDGIVDALLIAHYLKQKYR